MLSQTQSRSVSLSASADSNYSSYHGSQLVTGDHCLFWLGYMTTACTSIRHVTAEMAVSLLQGGCCTELPLMAVLHGQENACVTSPDLATCTGLQAASGAPR